MKKITSSKSCMNCKDPCCRFNKNYRRLAPIFTEEEYKKLIRYKKHFRKLGNSYQVKLSRWEKGSLLCPFASGKKCKIYDSRPFDCRTWPFFLVKSKGKILLCFDSEENCYIKLKNKATKEYIRYLEKHLVKRRTINMLMKHPELIYNDKYKEAVVCEIPKLTRALK